MAIILANNATAKLAGAITTAATSITVQSGQGALFPAPTSPDWFPVTLIDASGNIEICKCTARSGDILTVVRAQEGTSAKAFAAGSRVSLRVTKAVLDYVFSVVNPLNGLTPAADKMPYYTSASASALATLTAFARTLLDDADASTALSTLGVSTFIKTLLDDADAATARATIGAQASDATLTALAGLTGAADRLPYFNGADTATLATFTAFARSLLDDADAAAARATLGVLSTDEPFKSAADVATTANFASTYANGASGVGATLTASAVGVTTIDGIALTAGMRVLVKDQTTAAQNGIYTVTTAGTASVATVLTRSTDADTSARLAGATITVDQGTVNGSALFSNNFKKAGVIGTTSIAWRNVYDSGVASLAAIAAQTPAADRLPYFTGASQGSLATFTAFARSLLDDANASAARLTIGAPALAAAPADLNSITESGIYTISGSTNRPAGSNPQGDSVIHVNWDVNAAVQLYLPYSGGSLCWRKKAGSVWGAWVFIYHEGRNPTPADIGAQAADATLTALASLTGAANMLPYFNGADTAALTTFTAFARTLLDDADAATARATLGAQASDPTLTALAGLATSAGKFPYFTGTDSAALTGITTLARTFLEQDTEDGACIQIGAARVSSFRSVYGTNGYITLPRHDGGKIIIQWGKVAAMAANATAAVTFPTAFPSACDNIVTTPLNTVNTASMVAYPDSGSIKTTGFTMRGDTDNANTGVFWIAIGR